MKVLHLAAALTLAVALPVTAGAQKVPNLSGTWVMQADKSDFGMMPPPTSRTDVIDHKEPNLTIKRTVTSPQTGEITINLVFAVDGKPYKNVVGPSEVTSTLKWDGQSLVIVSTATGPQGEVTFTDRYALSEDGKTLTQNRVLQGPGEEFKAKMVFARQP